MNQIKNKSTQTTNFTLQDALGKETTVEQAISLIKTDSITYQKFLTFPEPVQHNILGFITGKHGLKITYDSFFQSILSPYQHPKRIESLLSAIFEEEVHIKEILPREGNRMVEEGSLIIVDILLQLSNGSYINVEMQKYGYLFPGERSDCYVADFIMRQYNKLKAEKKDTFSYKDMKPFYIIILMEKSSAAFLDVFPRYIHNEQTTYDSGAKVTTLSHIKYISLDTFHETVQNITNKLDAWLTFLSSSKPEDIITLINSYPEFIELYKDISEFRTSPKELIHMYSEALAIADRNTVRLMIDDMKEQYDDLKEQYDSMKEQVDNMREQYNSMKANADNMREQYNSMKANADNMKEQVSNLTAQVAEKSMENARLKQLLLDSGIDPEQFFYQN